MTRLFALLAVALVPWPLSAQDPGFSPDEPAALPTQLAGRWINAFYFARPDEPPRPFWQIVEFDASGQAQHSYFSRDPVAEPSTPYTSIISTWQAGLFVDPEAAKGIFPVIRLKPSEQINYDALRDRFQHIRGNFGPQFRRYTLSSDGAQLTLSELVVLEVPGDIVISFPSAARDMVFSRLVDRPSAVEWTSWGQIKRGER